MIFFGAILQQVVFVHCSKSRKMLLSGAKRFVKCSYKQEFVQKGASLLSHRLDLFSNLKENC